MSASIASMMAARVRIDRAIRPSGLPDRDGVLVSPLDERPDDRLDEYPDECSR
jgi:hypothetical protein